MPGSSDPSSAPVSSTVCPLCGAPNECGLEAGLAQCWCMTEKISPDVLSTIPAVAKDRACICRACAAKSSSATDRP